MSEKAAFPRGREQVTADALKLAKKLGHAACVAVKHHRYSNEFAAFDSWTPLPDDWKVVALVSSSGKVVASAGASVP